MFDILLYSIYNKLVERMFVRLIGANISEMFRFNQVIRN